MGKNHNTLKSVLTITLLLVMSNGLNAQTFKTYNVGKNIKLQGISFFNETEGYMCGDGGSIYKINTDETISEITTPTTEELWRISVIPGTQGLGFVAVGKNNTILKSLDGGITINKQNVAQAPGSFIFGVQCLDANTYYACGGDFTSVSGTVLKTTDGGATWSIIPILGSFFIDNIFFVDNTTGYAAGGGQGSGAVYKTTDGGVTWKSVLATSALIVNLFCFDKNDIIAVGLGGQIFKTSNGGQNWDNVSLNTDDYFGIAFLDSTTGYITGGSNSGVLLKTGNGGTTWAPVSVTATENFWNMGLTPKRIVLLSSSGSWMASNLSSLAIQTPPALNFNVYPNPSSDRVYIEIKEKGMHQISVSTIEGKTVLTAQTDIDNNSINISDLQVGVYYIKVKSPDGQINTQKLIVN